MPAPDFIGNSSWTRQPGATLGIEGDNLVVYSIPYAGKMADADNFRAQWAKGNACPVSGWTHLTLENAPAITDGEGDKGSATLRFIGPDVSGDFGEADPELREYHTDRQSVELESSTVQADNGPWAGLYAFDKSYVIVSKIKTAKQSAPGATPSNLDDPVLLNLEKNNPNGEVLDGTAPAAKDIPNDGTVYKVKTQKSFLRQLDNGNGAWHIEELHEKTIVGKDEV